MVLRHIIALFVLRIPDSADLQFVPIIKSRQLNPPINLTKIKYIMKNGIYISSLILIGISIFLLSEYPDSGRMCFIAGVTTFLGFALNITGYIWNRKQFRSNIM